MKKYLVILIVVLASVLIISGCGAPAANNAGNQSTTRGNSGSESPSGKITFFYWDENQKPGMEKVIEILKADAPAVEVESTIIPWGQYWTKLQTSLPSSSEPDVFWLNYSHAIDYYPAGLCQEISTYIQRDGVDMSPFPDALNKMYSYEGKQYSIPKDYDTIALFYNKALFDAQGLDYPTDTWTWSDLKDAAIKLTDGTNYGFVATPSTQETVYSWVLSNEGTLISDDLSRFTFNNPNTIEAIQWLVDAMYVHKFSPDAASQLEIEAEDLFMSGRIGMVTGGSWNVPPFFEALEDNLGVARLPIAKKEANVIHGLGITMSSRSTNKEAAWALMRAFATQAAGEAQASVVIPAYKGSEEVWIKNFPTLNLKVFIDAAKYAVAIPTAYTASDAQDTVVGDALQSIWLQDEDIAAAVARIDAECAALADGK